MFRFKDAGDFLPLRAAKIAVHIAQAWVRVLIVRMIAVPRNVEGTVPVYADIEPVY